MASQSVIEQQNDTSDPAPPQDSAYSNGTFVLTPSPGNPGEGWGEGLIRFTTMASYTRTFSAFESERPGRPNARHLTPLSAQHPKTQK